MSKLNRQITDFSKLGIACAEQSIPDSGEAPQIITERSYTKLLSQLRCSGFAHPLRMWNIIPHINKTESGLERYRSFCNGRKAAFDRSGLAPSSYPAATAVGSFSNRYVFVLIGSQSKPDFLSNPNQVEAYSYPAYYGPTPPSFARAAIFGDLLFLSGTAAIKGSSSCFIGDATKQTEATIENIIQICGQYSNLKNRLVMPQDLGLRVFIRNSTDLPSIRYVLEQHGLDSKSTEYFQADICRKELLVEIEGLYNGL